MVLQKYVRTCGVKLVILSVCLRHLFKLRIVANLKFISKITVFLHKCTTCFELPSNTGKSVPPDSCRLSTAVNTKVDKTQGDSILETSLFKFVTYV